LQPGQGQAWPDEPLRARPVGKENDCPAGPRRLSTRGAAEFALAATGFKGKKRNALETALNHQAAVGGDVISRTTHAASGRQNLPEFQTIVLEGLAGKGRPRWGLEAGRKISAPGIFGNSAMERPPAAANRINRALAQVPSGPLLDGVKAPAGHLAPGGKAQHLTAR
jgi:hypothetical protein